MKQFPVAIITTPKCACSTIKTWAYHQDKRNPIFTQVPSIHVLAIQNNATPTPNVDYVYYKFVRNPYHRIISAYKEKVVLPCLRAGSSPMSFSSFLCNINDQPVESLNAHWRPQTIMDYVDASPTVFKIEDGIQQRLDFISTKHNMTTINTTPVNVTPMMEDPIVSDSDRDIIWNLYKEDFITYGYDMPELPI